MEYVYRGPRPEERRAVEEMVREAFWNVHVPGCDEHLLMHRLWDDKAYLPQMHVVVECEGRLVAGIVYTRGWVHQTGGGVREVLVFGPLHVLPGYQGKGLGGRLVRLTLERAKRTAYQAVMIYGDPLYYGRFGFELGERFGIVNGEGEVSAALMAMPLKAGGLADMKGKFCEAKVFSSMTRAEVEAFDVLFAPKPKMVTATQARFRQLAFGE